MKVIFITIVIDGMPWITHHYHQFCQLPFEWEWRIAEGVALPHHCTAWCAGTRPRLSLDGTTRFLLSLGFDRRVTHRAALAWDGKVAMVNSLLDGIEGPVIIMQIDADEIWTAMQLEFIQLILASKPSINTMDFFCDYRLGPGIRISKGHEWGNNPDTGWVRAWRVDAGPVQFASHENPVIEGLEVAKFCRETTAKMGLVFRHEALTTENQVRFKQEYYAREFSELHAHWLALQRNDEWPARLDRFMPWAGNIIVDRVKSPTPEAPLP